MAEKGVRVPHMIDFTADGAYGFLASTGSGDVSVIRTADRNVVAVLPTGPGTYMAVVKPGDGAALAAVIGNPKVPRDGKLVEITIDKQRGEFKIARTLDTEKFSLVAAYPPDEVNVNCGTTPTRDGKHMLVNYARRCGSEHPGSEIGQDCAACRRQ